MLHELRQFISEKQLFQPEDKILLTVSGGIDSVVLFDLFLKAGFYFAVAHCNFSLRGEESDGDEQFVSNLAIRNGISFHVKRFDTSSFANERALSIQMAARELRYQWFEELLDSYKYKYVATAHQLNDIIETMLINLSRGTGIAGLHGIAEKNGRIIRPLLFSGRDGIRAYAEENALHWREDSSNVEEKYARNLIRHRVVPVLKNLNPNLENTFRQNAERLKGAEMLFKYHIKEYKKALLIQNGTSFQISLTHLNCLPEPFVILTELLLPFGFNFKTIQTIYQQRNQSSGKRYYAPEYTLYSDRDMWFIAPVDELETFEYTIPENEEHIELPMGSVHFEVIDAIHFKGFRHNNAIAYISMDQLQWPLTIRSWQEGDRFQPFGMKGMKKVSDFMIDAKIPVPLKQKTPMLCSDNKLIWVVGHRLDDRFKITDTTEKILVCTFQPLMQDPDNTKDREF
ncbi:MAG: tRNA lysidine(34) synthetase TilS [Cytophagales bacterium]|nr:tRNA lysidine(34) synthetase TilS [Cytophaga sp.]